MTIKAGLVSLTLRAERADAGLLAGLGAADLSAGLTTLQLMAEREAMDLLASAPSVTLQSDAGEE